MNKQINFQAEITILNNKDKHIKLNTYASTAKELYNNIKAMIDTKESKFNILKIFGIK